MTLEIVVHHYVHGAQDEVLPLLKRILSNQEKTMATLDDVVAKVTNLGTVEDSIVALLVDLKAKLDAAGTDPVKLQALSDALSAQTQKLADAVTANTPAAPTP
jgi:hypothetical protein